MYVAVCSGSEDLLKVGLSRDPLARWSALHPRWFEAFDLQHSVLVETETRRDAQQLETALHRRLLAHNCPPPSTIRVASGGGTEWYRGAFSAVWAFCQAAAAEGFVVHTPAREWFVRALQPKQDALFALLDQAVCLGLQSLNPKQSTLLRDLLDAHIQLDPTLRARLDRPILDAFYGAND